ncbi:MAG: D-Ala-D-Ala carboxypeptidase family metallohydrolase [Rhizobacter sp.]
MFYLTQHFSVEEFTASQTAARLQIDNSLPDHLVDDARETARLHERIRDYLKHLCGREIPILTTSGYRCLTLNRVVGSSDTSDHVIAAAMDWRAPAFGNPTKICEALASQVSALGIGQLINEYPDANGWVHTSTRPVDKMVNRIITIKHSGTTPGIHA